MNKYKEPVELNDEEIEMRDVLIEELKHRTKASIVEIDVYKIHQNLSPITQHEHQYTIECRVNNQTSILVTSLYFDVMARTTQMHYAFRDIANRMMDHLLKVGAQAM